VKPERTWLQVWDTLATHQKALLAAGALVAGVGIVLLALILLFSVLGVMGAL